jgi:TetR/AcrR family transcriptional regulator of autoinduction and epiphytic fitness
MKIREGSDEAVPKARPNGSREAIVAAAERLFLERKFGAVSMDDLVRLHWLLWAFLISCLLFNHSK